MTEKRLIGAQGMSPTFHFNDVWSVTGLNSRSEHIKLHLASVTMAVLTKRNL